MWFCHLRMLDYRLRRKKKDNCSGVCDDDWTGSLPGQTRSSDPPTNCKQDPTNVCVYTEGASAGSWHTLSRFAGCAGRSAALCWRACQLMSEARCVQWCRDTASFSSQSGWADIMAAGGTPRAATTGHKQPHTNTILHCRKQEESLTNSHVNRLGHYSWFFSKNQIYLLDIFLVIETQTGVLYKGWR